MDGSNPARRRHASAPPHPAAALFAAGAQAADSYRQFTAGNPDIASSRAGYEDITAVQPGVGSDIDRYHDFGDGNPDLFDIDLKGAKPARTAPGGWISTVPSARAPT